MKNTILRSVRFTAVALFTVLLVGTAWAETATVSFLDVGQGDSILIRSPEGKIALVDAGPSNDVMDVLKEEGVEKIDMVVVSHHHTDHMQGMIEVVKTFKPKVYVDSGSSHTSKTYKKLLSAVDEAGCQLVQPKADSERKIDLGSVTLRLFPQPPEDEDNENNNSVGIRLEYGKFSVLLIGDSEEDERAWWRKNINKTLFQRASVLKVAHHGSYNGTNATWLKAVKPKLAVISCGEDNSYRHPHEATLRLLDELKIPIKRTDIDGTITIESNGKTWKIKDRADEDNHASIRHATLRLAA